MILGRLRWAKKFGGKDTAALLKQWQVEDFVDSNPSPKKLVGPKVTKVVDVYVVDGQVISTRRQEAIEYREGRRESQYDEEKEVPV